MESHVFDYSQKRALSTEVTPLANFQNSAPSVPANYSPLSYTSIIKRGFAEIIDECVVVVPLIIVMIAIGIDIEIENAQATASLLGITILYLAYHTVLEAKLGQIIGKKFLKSK